MNSSAMPPAALVTGGATRLGRHFALTLASAGYNIALHYNSSAKAAEDVRQEIVATGRQCELLQNDFSGDSDAKLLIERARSHFPGLNLLINNASAYAEGNITETDRDQLQEQFSVNLFMPFLLTAAFARQAGKGSIVNIIDNKIGFQQHVYAAYLLAKKSLADFTRLAAIELAPQIRVNGIAPGVILPGESRSNDYVSWRKQGIPLLEQGSLEHLSSALHYLLDNDFVTGQVLFVDGGEAINNVGRNALSYTGTPGVA